MTGCRDLGAADMVRNSRTGTVVVDAGARTVTLDGEPLDCEPICDLAHNTRYLL